MSAANGSVTVAAVERTEGTGRSVVTPLQRIKELRRTKFIAIVNEVLATWYTTNSLHRVRIPNSGMRATIMVPTTEIVGHQITLSKTQVKNGYFFKSGNWDRNFVPIDDFGRSDPRWIFFEEVLEQGKHLADTKLYRSLMGRLARGKARGKLTSEEKIVSFLAEKLVMHEEIERQGRLMSQYARTGRNGGVSCCLGRDGRLLLTINGNHRLAIARRLGLSMVPIQVDFMHADMIDVVRRQEGRSALTMINNFLKDFARAVAAFICMIFRSHESMISIMEVV